MVTGRVKSRGNRRKVLQIIFISLTLALLLAGGALSLFKNLGPWLIESKSYHSGSARIALILMGDTVGRAEFAAKLWKKGEADHLIFFECQKSPLEQRGWVKSDATLTRLILLENGVPESAIIQIKPEKASTSTVTEAQNLRSWIEESAQLTESKEITIVTSWYHTSRSLWIFDKVFEGTGYSFRMASAPTEGAKPEQWWTNESVFLLVVQEYLKWMYYLTHYT